MKIWRFLPLLAVTVAVPAWGQSTIPPVNGTVVYATGGAWGVSSAPALTGISLTGLSGGGLRCVTVDNSGTFGAQACGGGGGSGTVTSITATAPLTGGTVTTTGAFGLNIDSTLSLVGGQLHVVGGGGGTPGGSSGQTQYNNSGAFGGYTMSGSCTITTSSGVIACPLVGNAIQNWTASGNASVILTQGAGGKVAGHQVVYDANGNGIDGGAPGSGGTVTSVATGTGLTGGPITTTGTVSVAANGITNALAAQMPLYSVKGNVTGGTANAADIAMPSCVDSGGNHLNWVNATGFTCGTSGGGGGTAVQSYGVFGGAVNAYTMVSPTPAVSSNVDGYRVCGFFPSSLAANTGASTFAAGSAAALPIRVKSANNGAITLSGKEILPGTNGNPICLQLANSAAYWVLDSQAPGNQVQNPSSPYTVTQGDWASQASFLQTAASTTYNLPTSTTISNQAGISIQTGDVTAQLCASGSDVIDSGMIGGGSAGGCITLPANRTFPVSLTTANNYFVPLGNVEYAPLSWGVGQDLSLSTGGITFVRFAVPRVVYSISCKNNTLAGGTQTATFKYQTDAGGATGAGTTISSAPFDMNANLGVKQSVGLTSTPLQVPANYDLGFIVSGSATAGSGYCQFTYR